ncbi:MAG: shikimate dehydrogenase [Pirellulales bacterium]|nr:shikimate dehydrogenase [Pirellulales bacterium]
MSSPAVQPLLALLAHPVGGNPTQYLVERAFAERDLDWRYMTFEVAPKDLAAAVGGLRVLGFQGAHCDHPHKQAVIPLLDRVDETAAAVGAVNFIYRREDTLVGDNLEGRGFVESLRRLVDPAGKQVVILGAGRLARAAGVELAAAGASLMIVNRTLARAEELAALLVEKYKTSAVAAAWEGDFTVPLDTEVLLQATSIDQTADRLPLGGGSLRPELIVADAAINPPQTRLLRDAAERGCKTIDGLCAFIEQVAIALRRWTGAEPDRQTLREAAEEFLEL